MRSRVRATGRVAFGAMCVDKVASVRYRLYFDRGLTRALDSYCNNVYAVVLPVTYGRCVVP